MSILKVILHHWNKTTQSYDNFHPETEVSQVTDWNQGIVNTLASTALGGLVNTLTSDSLLAKMIQKVLEATGVKYSLEKNGYVCFGSLVGGLIIQWGYVDGVNPGSSVALPLSATPTAVVTMDVDTANNALVLSTGAYAKGSFRLYGNRISPSGDNRLWGHWIAVCK